ncbi:DUF1326 domain-containing protein [Paracoccus niistensis]|uniref:DUF1326 domain-containing protein n=1 Tax=Paracoccus niistensis TaxID=632935 RepID=A0ABV6I533_9RHOB
MTDDVHIPVAGHDAHDAMQDHGAAHGHDGHSQLGAGYGRPLAVPQPGRVPYTLSGDFLEVCDCFTICPCWTGRSPDNGECTGVFAWAIREGQIDGLDMAGRRVVSVSTHEGHRDGADQQVLLFVDDGAGDKEARLLVGTFSGIFGGPLGDLGRILGTLLGAARAKIELDLSGRRARLSVGRVIAAESTPVIGATGRATQLSDARLSAVLGDPAEVGVARSLKVALPWHGLDIDLRERSAMRGPFAYTHDPAREA